MSSALNHILRVVTQESASGSFDVDLCRTAEDFRIKDPLATIVPIMSKYGVSCPVEQFHHSVNLAFHRAESRVYDQLHVCMWNSLPRQCQLLVQDYVHSAPEIGSDLVALDIGCGTGLASDMLLKSQIGKYISQIDLLDTSEEMLERAKQRAQSWSATANLLHGGLKRLTKGTRKYDVIIICSVLHHIPDLEEFFRQIGLVQSPSGILLHLQDPNGDCRDDPEQKRRIAELSENTARLPGWVRRVHPKRVMKSLHRKLSGRYNDSYIRQANDDLLNAGIVTKHMTAPDIWKVTDIHCSDGLGISIAQIARHLPDYALVSQRSYGFFGRLFSELPPAYMEKEDKLIDSRALNGAYIGAIWKKKIRNAMSDRQS